jgi:hypothetical protein
MTQYELENPYTLLYKHSEDQYIPKSHWCVDKEFTPAVYPQVGGSGEVRTPDSLVRSEIL